MPSSSSTDVSSAQRIGKTYDPLAPVPPPKDTPSTSGTDTPPRLDFPGKDSDAIYRNRGLSRAGSVYSAYSLSRESFASHLAQLTSIKLPDASALSSSIDTITSAPKAVRALNEASEDVQRWIQNSTKVLSGLDAKDDVEWAAAAGKDAIGEVKQAIARFDDLIRVYVSAVEKVHLRADVRDVPAKEMSLTVDKVEKTTADWQRVKDNLRAINTQVELAIEWEEIRNSLFEEAWQEAEGITRQIFEMEEERHNAGTIQAQKDTVAGMDIRDIETILGDNPDNRTRTAQVSTRITFPRPRSPTSPVRAPAIASAAEEDTATLSLYARMQPLRASLDFLPIRIASFEAKAADVFPTACRELKDRRDALEEQWQQLQDDADTLKREIGEDRWVMIFRNCGRKAMSLIDSVERSIKKLDETLDSNTQLQHAPATLSRIENYEAKKVHYCPAIERTIAVLDRGVKDRLTVNGEIIRLQREIQSKWRATLADVRTMDQTLDFYDPQKTQQLRDSVSTVVSSDRSFQSSTLESLGSSPPSSVEGASRNPSRHRQPSLPPREPSRTRQASRTRDASRAREASLKREASPPPREATPPKREPSRTRDASPFRAETPSTMTGRPRDTSISSNISSTSTAASRRHSHLPLPIISTPPSKLAAAPSKTPLTRSSAHGTGTRSVSSPISRYSPSIYTPAKSPRSTSSSSSGPKPRWNVSTNLNGSSIGHNFRPLAVTEPSPYAKPPPVKHTPTVRHTSSSLHPSPAGSSPLSRRTSIQPGARSPSLSPSAPSSRLGSMKANARRPSSLVMSSPISPSVASAPYSPDSPLDTIPPRADSRASSKRHSLLPRPASRASATASAAATPVKHGVKQTSAGAKALPAK